MEDDQMKCVDLCAAVCVGMTVGVGAALGVGGAMPGVGVTFAGGDGSVMRVADGEMQDDSAVAAGSCLEILGVIATGSVGLPVPDVAAAVCQSDVPGYGIVNRQVQGDNAVAAIGGTADVSVCGGVVAAGIVDAMPKIRPAGVHGLHTMNGRALAYCDGDVDRLAGAVAVVTSDAVGGCCDGGNDDGIGAFAGGPNVILRTGSGERGALVHRDVGVARDGHDRIGHDGEVKGVDLCASVSVRMGVPVGAALRVGGAIPGVLAALGDRNGLVYRIVDGKVQGVDLCAAVSVKMGVQISAALRVSGSVPSVLTALADCLGLVVRVVDGQVQGDDAVTAVGGTVGDDVARRTGALRVGGSVPSVVVTGCGGHHTLCGNAIAYRNGDVNHLACATAVVTRDGVGGRRGGRDGDGVGVRARGPDITLRARCSKRGALACQDADVARNSHVRDGRDGEVQGVDLGATVSVRMGVPVGATLYVSGAMPGVLAALADREGLVYRILYVQM